LNYLIGNNFNNNYGKTPSHTQFYSGRHFRSGPSF
jgi:hypothetical protein